MQYHAIVDWWWWQNAMFFNRIEFFMNKKNINFEEKGSN